MLISKHGIILKVSMGILILTRILQAIVGRKNMALKSASVK